MSEMVERVARGAIDNSRYEAGWLDANPRIRQHPQAAHLIVSRYSSRHWRDARRTAVCAASFNTPLWQAAVAEAYPTRRQASFALDAPLSVEGLS